MRQTSTILRLVAAFGLCCALVPGALAASTARADAEALLECVSRKAGPEGDLPPAGELRSRMLKEMEGGPQACVGQVRQVCVEAGGDHHDCSRRETAAWLEALKRDPGDGRAANHGKWLAAVRPIRGQAVALCQGAAALSAWGYDTVRRTGSYDAGLLAGCVMDAVAQQALILLVTVRGN